MDKSDDNGFIKFIVVEMGILFIGGELCARNFANIASTVTSSHIL